MRGSRHILAAFAVCLSWCGCAHAHAVTGVLDQVVDAPAAVRVDAPCHGAAAGTADETGSTGTAGETCSDCPEQQAMLAPVNDDTALDVDAAGRRMQGDDRARALRVRIERFYCQRTGPPDETPVRLNDILRD